MYGFREGIYMYIHICIYIYIYIYIYIEIKRRLVIALAITHYSLYIDVYVHNVEIYDDDVQ
jgi:hypothetical protein